MTWGVGSYLNVHVVGGDGSYGHSDTPRGTASIGQKSEIIHRTGNVSGQKSGPVLADFPHESHARLLVSDRAPAFDPHRVHREFPARWQAYIRANYRDIHQVCQVFAVSERAARKWWKGEGGVNAGYVAIAKRKHPVQAERMLFAAE